MIPGLHIHSSHGRTFRTSPVPCLIQLSSTAAVSGVEKSGLVARDKAPQVHQLKECNQVFIPGEIGALHCHVHVPDFFLIAPKPI